MKQPKKIITVIIAVIAVIFSIQSCKKNNNKPNYNSDKTKLSLQIDSAQTLYSAAIEGKAAGDYSIGSKTVFKTAIDLAVGVKSGSFTQQEVNNAAANLKRAETAFNTNIIQEVSPDNLVAYWKFDGDTKDASGNGHDGTLKTGWVGSSVATASDGGTLPTLTTDRNGVANMAYAFNNGAYIEVPYAASLRPSSFTITAWVKVAAASNGNYIFSLDRWNGYKFQLQSNNFPFVTINTDAGDHDIDDNPGAVAIGTWAQVAVSYTSGTATFYINGVLTKTVSSPGTPIPLPTIVNLAIGNEMPKGGYNFTDSSSPQYFYGASFFMGSIDDMRLYNKVLTDAEVHSIFIQESPN
ncbi:LamG domain-containing protein [Mucilaginibacter sp. BJC16-A38]|uniref:LamG domain-containing protein n=1 Tax=Mucilaginibacter phenanthrenivorans TaxID=1234842 RepID=UPI002157A0E8|nr:LamG domain-containing protein [Mucilaginibacter phenanthrenivorans]MCR8559579.1 LamG domain-containing protein [Mucilaginibacter phenanthrenivorans]